MERCSATLECSSRMSLFQACPDCNHILYQRWVVRPSHSWGLHCPARRKCFVDLAFIRLSRSRGCPTIWQHVWPPQQAPGLWTCFCHSTGWTGCRLEHSSNMCLNSTSVISTHCEHQPMGALECGCRGRGSLQSQPSMEPTVLGCFVTSMANLSPPPSSQELARRQGALSNAPRPRMPLAAWMLLS